MKALRITAPRASRPQLSHRYRTLRRLQTHEPATPTPAPSPLSQPSVRHPAPASSYAPPPPPVPSPGLFRRYRGAFIGSVTGLALGLFAGQALTDVICPPSLPAFGTPADAILTAELNRRIDEEFKVKVLRGKCLGVTKQLKGGEGGWVEIVPQPGPTQDEVLHKGNKLLDSLQGAKGFGVERIFWDRGEEKLVAIIWLGGGVIGWPRVAHGGVIATQLVEKVALAAALNDEKHGKRRDGAMENVTEAAVPQRLPGIGAHARMYAPSSKPTDPSQFALSYVKPTFSDQFYVIRVSNVLDLEKDPEHIVPGEPVSGQHDFEATLESLDSRVHVKSKVKFAPSSWIERVEHRALESTEQTYSDFKQWLWPSRQSSSQV